MSEEIASPTPPTRKLRIFRMIDDARVPFVIELDHQLTVISEKPDQEAFHRVVYGRTDEPNTRTMTVWSTMEVANPIPGTEELRAKYQEELQAMHKRAADNHTICKPCEVGKLIRRYRLILEAGGYL